MIAIKEQMIQTSQLDLKGLNPLCRVLSTFTPVTTIRETFLRSVCPLRSWPLASIYTFAQAYTMCSFDYSPCITMEATLCDESQYYIDCVHPKEKKNSKHTGLENVSTWDSNRLCFDFAPRLAWPPLFLETSLLLFLSLLLLSVSRGSDNGIMYFGQREL